MLHADDYGIIAEDGRVIVKKGDKVVLVYPIDERVRQNPLLLDNPDSLFQWCNDSLMLVLNSMYVDAKGMPRPYSYSFQLFRKSK